MKLVKLDDDVWVNPEHVVSVDHKDADICVWLVNGQYYELPLDVDVYEVLDRLDGLRNVLVVDRSDPNVIITRKSVRISIEDESPSEGVA